MSYLPCLPVAPRNLPLPPAVEKKLSKCPNGACSSANRIAGETGVPVSSTPVPLYGLGTLFTSVLIVEYFRRICELDVAGTLSSSSALTNGRLPQASQGKVDSIGSSSSAASAAREKLPSSIGVPRAASGSPCCCRSVTVVERTECFVLEAQRVLHDDVEMGRPRLELVREAVEVAVQPRRADGINVLQQLALSVERADVANSQVVGPLPEPRARDRLR